MKRRDRHPNLNGNNLKTCDLLLRSPLKNKHNHQNNILNKQINTRNNNNTKLNKIIKDYNKLKTTFNTLFNDENVNGYIFEKDTIASKNYKENKNNKNSNNNLFRKSHVISSNALKQMNSNDNLSKNDNKYYNNYNKNDIINNIVKIFQRGNPHKTFKHYDRNNKGYLDVNDIYNILNHCGYEYLLSKNMKLNIYELMNKLCNGEINLQNLRKIDITREYYLGDTIKRDDYTEILRKKYLNNKQKIRSPELYYINDPNIAANIILHKMVNKYNNKISSVKLLKNWDLDCDHRIQKNEAKIMLQLMNIHLNDDEMNAWFDIFLKNETCEHHLKDGCVSYDVFFRTMHGGFYDQHNLDGLLDLPQKNNNYINKNKLNNELIILINKIKNIFWKKFGDKQFCTKLFRYIDINKNGIISHNELKIRLMLLDNTINEIDINKLCQYMDPNNTGNIYYEQFISCFGNTNVSVIKQNKKNIKQKYTESGLNIDPNSSFYINDKDRFIRYKNHNDRSIKSNTKKRLFGFGTYSPFNN